MKIVLQVASSLVLAIGSWCCATQDDPHEPPQSPEVQKDSRACLGGICLGQLEQEVTAKYGQGFLTPSGIQHCYQISSNRWVSFTVDLEYKPPGVSVVLVTTVPHCPGALPLEIGAAFSTYKGVQLGDSLSRVATLHGTLPSERQAGYPWSDAGRGIQQLNFSCTTDAVDNQKTSIYIRNDSVVGIALWASD